MSVLHLSIISPKSEYPYEARYPSDITLAQLKAKLELIVGVLTQDMNLKVHNEYGKFIGELNDDEKTLEELNIVDKFSIHVTDITGNLTKFDSNSDISERYTMDNSKYDSLKDSARQWMKDLGVDKSEVRIPDFAQVGAKCVVGMPNQQKRYGTIAFTGKTHFKPGNWIGVVYDEAVGKNDGSIDGQRYFTCEPNHGSFVSPKFVSAADETNGRQTIENK